MDVFFTPDIGPLLFSGLAAASLISAFIGVFTAPPAASCCSA